MAELRIECKRTDSKNHVLIHYAILPSDNFAEDKSKGSKAGRNLTGLSLFKRKTVQRQPRHFLGCSLSSELLQTEGVGKFSFCG